MTWRIRGSCPVLDVPPLRLTVWLHASGTAVATVPDDSS
jgi:hypothetical protein